MLHPISDSAPKVCGKGTSDLCDLLYNASQMEKSSIRKSLTCGPSLCSNIIPSSINLEPNFVCSGLEGCAVALTVRKVGQDRAGTCIEISSNDFEEDKGDTYCGQFADQLRVMSSPAFTGATRAAGSLAEIVGGVDHAFSLHYQ